MPTQTLPEPTTDAQKEWVLEVARVLGAKEPALGVPRVEVREPSCLDADRTEDLAIEKARRERRRALILPREHGAWGLLLVPLITGGGIALRQSSNVFPLLLLFTTALILFWLRTPVESLLGTSAIKVQTEEEFRDVLFVAGYLGIVAALALGMLVWSGRNPLLWWIGAAAGTACAGESCCCFSTSRQRATFFACWSRFSEKTWPPVPSATK